MPRIAHLHLAVITAILIAQPASAERIGGAFTPQIENDRIADTDRHYTHGTRLAFAHVFRTKEFDGQRRDGRYGALSLSVRL